MTDRPELSILVPAYNESEVLAELEARLWPILDQLPQPLEIILVDDGSTDSTPELLRALHQRDPRVRVIRLSRNFGHQMALSAGLAASCGKGVVILDADLQDPPELLPEFVKLWREGHSVVYGIRKNRKGSWLKRIAYRCFYALLTRVSAVTIPADAGDYCLMDRRVVDLMVAMPERVRFLRGLRSWVGFSQIGVPYPRPERAAGKVKYSWRKLFQLGMDGLLSFSHAPLRLASLVGLTTAALACGALVFYLAWWALDFSIAERRPQDVGGFMTLITLILFFAGIQLLFLGVVGEYIGRIYQEIKGRPGWVVEERLGFRDEDGDTKG